MHSFFTVLNEMDLPESQKKDWKKPSNLFSVCRCQGFHGGGHRRETVSVKIILDYEPLSSWVSRDPLRLPGLISNSCTSPAKTESSS